MALHPSHLTLQWLVIVILLNAHMHSELNRVARALFEFKWTWGCYDRCRVSRLLRLSVILLAFMFLDDKLGWIDRYEL